MPGREVERVEVVVRRLDLAPVDDPVAEAEEDVLDLAADLRDQVEVSARPRVARKRHVDDLLLEPPLEVGTLELRLARRDSRLEPLADGVQNHPRLAVADLSEGLLQLALSAQVADARVVQPLDARRGPNRALRLGFERLRVHPASVSSASVSPCSRFRGAPLGREASARRAGQYE